MLMEFIEKYRSNRRILLLIVYVALFLDNMLLTTVVPIIPEYLLRISHPNSTEMILHASERDAKFLAERRESQLATDYSTTAPQFAVDYDKPPRLRKRASNGQKPVAWDSDDWGEDDYTVRTTKGPRRLQSRPEQKSRPRLSAKSRSRSKSTTAPPDSYESLPDEFGIGFQGSNSAMQSAAREFDGVLSSKYSPAYADDDNENDNDDDAKKLSAAEKNAARREKSIAQRQKYRHETLSEENVHVGLMFGSKALVQLVANPMVGPLTNKVGYTIPMFTGFVIMFLSTLLFAFGSSFSVLWLARALQGIGSACTSTSGMGMLAQAYPDDAERGSAMGIALGGLALGVLVGPPFGGFLYEWAGKELPFILLALLALCDGTLQFFILQPKVDRGKSEGTAIKELAKDPYIIVAAGSITIGNLGIAMLEPSLPLWMMESWGASSIERGAAFLPASISYMIGTNVFGPLAHKIGRWLSGFIGLVVIGFCLLAIPSARSISGLILPNFFMGFSIGMIDASMFPMMGYIVDVRHVGVYGSIYAIADAAFCFAFALGPFFSGPLVRTVGFPTMMYFIAITNFIYAPLMFFLRKLPENLPATNESSAIIGVSQNPSNYEKIDGFSQPITSGLSIQQTNVRAPLPQSNHITSAVNYHYDINSVWDE